MPYGLTEREITLLLQVFSAMPEVEEVYLYGSRARENWKKTSDIDLAVKFSEGFGGSEGVGKLRLQLDELPFLYEVDVADVAEFTEGDFLREFEAEKKLLYQKEE